MAISKKTLATVLGFITSFFIQDIHGVARASARSTENTLLIHVRGNKLRFAPEFIPKEDLGGYRDAITHDVVRLRFDWPSMGAFKPVENLPPPLRYRNQLAVSIAPAEDETVPARRKYLEDISSIHAINHVPNGSLFDLQRSSLPLGKSAPLGNRDVMTHWGDMDTTISCDAEGEVAPGSNGALVGQSRGKVTRTPYCTQIFFVPGLHRAFIRTSYQRIHLKDWVAIQQQVTRFVIASIVPD